MTEASLQRGLLQALRAAFPKFVIFKHSEVLFSGVADISITGNKITSWLELKLAKPVIKSKGIQQLMMQRLARAGHAYYVVYTEKNMTMETSVVRPIDMGVVRVSQGVDHLMVVDFVRGLHTYDPRHFT
jgi:hypothetical protein